MTKVTCDRCGKIMDMDLLGYIFSNHEDGQWVPTILINAKDPETGKARKIDICEDCEKALYTFIFGEKVKT